MEKRKLLIADSTEAFRLAMEDILRDEFCICCTGDGREAMELLHSFAPDFLVLDVRLPGVNGIDFLQSVAQQGLAPNTLTITATASPWVVGKAWEFGVRHILQKPCSLSAAANQVRQMAGLCLEQKPRTELRISAVLLEMGFKAKHDGFRYLRDAVLIYERDPHQTLTKELYHTVAQMYGAKANQVERSIRSAIAYAWKFGDVAIQKRYFPEGRPTNGDAIARLTEYISMELFCKIG